MLFNRRVQWLWLEEEKEIPESCRPSGGWAVMEHAEHWTEGCRVILTPAMEIESLSLPGSGGRTGLGEVKAPARAPGDDVGDRSHIGSRLSLVTAPCSFHFSARFLAE